MDVVKYDYVEETNFENIGMVCALMEQTLRPLKLKSFFLSQV